MVGFVRGPTFKLVTRFASFVFPLYTNAKRVLLANLNPEPQLRFPVDSNQIGYLSTCITWKIENRNILLLRRELD